MTMHSDPGDVPDPTRTGAAGTAGGFPSPTEGLLVTHFLTVRDVAVSLDFYTRVFGAEIVFDENPATIKLANSWIIMNPGGGPTPDKPGIDLRPPEEGDPVSGFLNIRVADIATFYEHAVAEGAVFVTEPLDRKAEIRNYLRDPDGYYIEIGQSTGLLEGVHADPPADRDEGAAARTGDG